MVFRASRAPSITLPCPRSKRELLFSEFNGFGDTSTFLGGLDPNHLLRPFFAPREEKRFKPSKVKNDGLGAPVCVCGDMADSGCTGVVAAPAEMVVPAAAPRYAVWLVKKRSAWRQNGAK